MNSELLGSVETFKGAMQIFEVPNLWPSPLGSSVVWQRCYVAAFDHRPVGLVVVNDADLIPEAGHMPKPRKEGEPGWDGTGREIEDIYITPALQGKGPDGEPPLAAKFYEFLWGSGRADKYSDLRTEHGEKLVRYANPDAAPALVDATISANLENHYQNALDTAAEFLRRHRESSDGEG
ncbi:hypothetical protein [Kribbella sp. DT2]|uniref:hypothetical protein n=1 Tax=Kribbella sp. DT2 TaxID=3393427 RepID=UPI003CEF1F1D